MNPLDRIIAILTGRKVKDGNLWRVYDTDGNEIADASGVLLQGLHGFLLNNQSSQLLPASLGGAYYAPRRVPAEVEDEEITEAMPISMVNRLRNEFLSESLAHDLITRARVRKARAEEEALLMMF